MQSHREIVEEFSQIWSEWIEMSGDQSPHLMIQLLACEVSRLREEADRNKKIYGLR